jgi:cyclophilin family peptidyl-prolyl cis-trans isomerase
MYKMYKTHDSAAPAVPAEARQEPPARLLRLRTSAGEMLIDLRPDIAPLTSSALAALARRGFYDGLTFHRVVPDFVVQGGDPRGDGDGGPGWALPDEHSPLRFLRGTLGIATSGPETGGSQFFLCHSPQPHLDGRYTIAGELREGADVLDALQPGDTIIAAGAE